MFGRRKPSPAEARATASELKEEFDQVRAALDARKELLARPSAQAEVRYTVTAKLLADLDTKARSHPARLFFDDEYEVRITSVRPVPDDPDVWEADCVARIKTPARPNRHSH